MCTIHRPNLSFFLPPFEKGGYKIWRKSTGISNIFSEENKFLFQKAPAVSTVENLYLKEKKKRRKELRKRKRVNGIYMDQKGDDDVHTGRQRHRPTRGHFYTCSCSCNPLSFRCSYYITLHNITLPAPGPRFSLFLLCWNGRIWVEFMHAIANCLLSLYSQLIHLYRQFNFQYGINVDCIYFIYLLCVERRRNANLHTLLIWNWCPRLLLFLSGVHACNSLNDLVYLIKFFKEIKSLLRLALQTIFLVPDISMIRF